MLIHLTNERPNPLKPPYRAATVFEQLKLSFIDYIINRYIIDLPKGAKKTDPIEKECNNEIKDEIPIIPQSVTVNLFRVTILMQKQATKKLRC